MRAGWWTGHQLDRGEPGHSFRPGLEPLSRHASARAGVANRPDQVSPQNNLPHSEPHATFNREQAVARAGRAVGGSPTL